MIKDIRGIGPSLPQIDSPNREPDLKGPSFEDVLKEKSKSPIEKAIPNLNFSGHAVDRMVSRGIRLQSTDIKKLEDAVDKAQQKGSRETLVLMGDNAFIVNIKNRTVVTAMDRTMMKENVFTNIDSTVVL